MEFYAIPKDRADELYHYGVKGMKWGHRRGPMIAVKGGLYAKPRIKPNYSLPSGRATKAGNALKRMNQVSKTTRSVKTQNKQMTPEQKAERRKKAIKVGAAVAGTALAAYGAYKVNQLVKNKNVDIARQIGRRKDSTAARDLTSTDRMKNLKALGDGGIKQVSYRNNGRSTMGFYETTYADRAKQDNFVQAAKNVYRDYDVRRRKAKGKKVIEFK